MVGTLIGVADDGLPDFEALYGSGPMTARMAARLWFVADSTEGMYFDGMPEQWTRELPRGSGLRRRRVHDAFGKRFGILANRIAAGLAELTDLTTCTADEVALHMVIDDAHRLLDDGELDIDWIDALPHRRADDDFYGVKDHLFYDLDVLHLYDPAADGDEDPESDVYKAERFVNLHPRDWFKPFVKSRASSIMPSG